MSSKFNLEAKMVVASTFTGSLHIKETQISLCDGISEFERKQSPFRLQIKLVWHNEALAKHPSLI
jgi:hypothetical protein